MCDTHKIIDYRIFLKTGNAGNIISEKIFNRSDN